MIPVAERLDFLQGIPIFAGIDPAALEELTGEVVEIAVPADELVFREKEPGNEMFIIHSGSVEVIKHLDEPRETSLAVLKPRDFFGEMAIIECCARSASVRALKDTLLFRVKASQLHGLFKRRPEQYSILMLNVARDVSRRLRALDENWSAASRWSSLDEAMLRAVDA